MTPPRISRGSTHVTVPEIRSCHEREIEHGGNSNMTSTTSPRSLRQGYRTRAAMGRMRLLPLAPHVLDRPDRYKHGIMRSGSPVNKLWSRLCHLRHIRCTSCVFSLGVFVTNISQLLAAISKTVPKAGCENNRGACRVSRAGAKQQTSNDIFQGF